LKLALSAGSRPLEGPAGTTGAGPAASSTTAAVEEDEEEDEEEEEEDDDDDGTAAASLLVGPARSDDTTEGGGRFAFCLKKLWNTGEQQTLSSLASCGAHETEPIRAQP